MPWDWSFDQRGVRAAWALWFAILAGFTLATVVWPGMPSVTRTYRDASSAWLAGQEIYAQAEGAMNYLPQFAIFFSPFAKAPRWAGDALWRILQMGIYVSGLRRLAAAAHSGPGDLFLLLSLLALPGALASILNGQSNLLLAGAMAHATAGLIGGQRWAVAAWLMLGLVAKPIAIVMILLLAAAELTIIPWLLGGAVLTAAVPLVFDSWPYVSQQYRSWYQQLLLIAPSQEHRFDDINGLLRTLKVYLPVKVSFLISLAAAILTLALWRVGSRRLRPPNRELALLGLSAGYLMLFNPRTESNSYVILSPAIASLAARLLMVEQRRIGWLLSGLAILLGNAFWEPVWLLTKLWLKPVGAIAFVGYLGCEILRRPPKADVAGGTMG